MDMEENCSSGELQSQSHRRMEFKDEEGKQDELQIPTLASLDSVDLLHSKISKEEIPEVGMEFETEEAAYQFYNVYAYKAGFSVRRSKEHKDRSGKIIDRVFCCSCEGKRAKDKRDVNVKCHRPETRFGCLARMKVNCRVSGKYRIVQFVPEHNHMMCTPSKTYLCRSHRNSSPSLAAKADMKQNSETDPKATVEFMARQVQDCRNYLRSKRTVQMKMGDVGSVLEYLQKMQLEDPSFFYAIQVDEDDLITNILWADAKMMADYAHFGDVVCFDTTYRKNKVGRPFAMFVGLNHHKQITVFGAALLYDESSDTFMWLFDTFTKAMCGKRPKTILTDEDFAMKVALAAQWPETSHRLCIWHIFQNATIELSGVFAGFNEFAKDFSNCVYDYEDEDDFTGAWNAMLEKYSLQDNEWLRRIYNMKEKWALVYGRHTFCADMTSAQRSESMNTILKKYVNYKHDLLRFFQHFQRLINDGRSKELKADFRASQSTPSLSFPVEILKHAASVYTPKVFELFQAEMCKAYDCNMRLRGEDGTLTEYEITPYRKQHHHVVRYSSEGTVLCSCKKFEFVGILCSHALKVFSSKNLMRIPSQYILKRWTKSAKSGSVEAASAGTSKEDSKEMMGRRYKELCRLYTLLATRAAGTEKGCKIALDGLNRILEEVDASLKGVVLEENFLGPSHANKSVFEHNEITSGHGIDIRVGGINGTEGSNGRTGKRLRSGLERVTKKIKSQDGSFSDDVNYVTDLIQQSELPPLLQFNQQPPMGSCCMTLSAPAEQHMLPSSPHFTQQLNTNTRNLRMDAPLGWNLLTQLSQISQEENHCYRGK